MGAITLKFDDSTTKEKKNSSDITYNLKGSSDGGEVDAKLSLKSKDQDALDKVVKKILGGNVTMELKNV